MIRKLFYFSSVLILGGASHVSCTEDISDCPTTMCILASENGWQLTEVYEDGIKQTENSSTYKIVLTIQDAKAPEGTFIRTNTTGNIDNGRWMTENNNEVLTLIPDNDVNRKEPYIIGSFTPRTLTLIINRDSKKIGPTQLKYIFEPL